MRLSSKNFHLQLVFRIAAGHIEPACCSALSLKIRSVLAHLGTPLCSASEFGFDFSSEKSSSWNACCEINFIRWREECSELIAGIGWGSSSKARFFRWHSEHSSKNFSKTMS